jgi:hypothetical protein
MMKKWLKRSAAFLAVSFLTVAIAWFVYGYFYDYRLEQDFGRLSNGMSEQEVQSLMGKPDSVGKCGELGGYPDGCSKEYLYNPRLPVIENWAVFFDSRGLVLDKYDYISP